MAKLSSVVKDKKKKKKSDEEIAKSKRTRKIAIIATASVFGGIALLGGGFMMGRASAPSQSNIYVASSVKTAPFQQSVDDTKDSQISALTTSLSSLSDSTGITKYLTQIFSTSASDKIFEEENVKLANKYTFLTSILETNVKLAGDWTDMFKEIVNLTEDSNLDTVQTSLSNLTANTSLLKDYISINFPKKGQEDQSDYGVVGNVVVFPVSDLSETVIKMKKTNNTTDAGVESVEKQGEIVYYAFVPVTKTDSQSVLVYNITATPFSGVSQQTGKGQISDIRFVGELKGVDLTTLFKKNSENQPQETTSTEESTTASTEEKSE